MVQAFAFSRDFRNIKWGATLYYNMLRALCSGIIVTIVSLFFYNEMAAKGDYTLLMAWLIIPLGYPLIYLPMGLVLRALGNVFTPFAFVAACFALMVALGDPLVFLLHKINRNLVPVDRPDFFSLQMIIFVLDEPSM
jgi:hypothetical protein